MALSLSESPEDIDQLKKAVLMADPEDYPEDFALQRTIIFLQRMLQRLPWITGYLIFLSLTYIFLVIPFNLLTVTTIFKSQQLWTHTNVILAINSTVQAVLSTIMLYTRMGGNTVYLDPFHLPGSIGYTVSWWCVVLGGRTSNNW